MTILLWILLVAVIIYIAKGVLIVQQQEVMIIERLGKYEKTLESGLNFIIPVFEAPRGMAKTCDTKGA